ncbi:MAG: AAA family ATPase, partial [Eubacteriaceae bacterium]
MIKKLQFENYRCFKNSSISFKEIATIVGKNNAGKSTVIEALRMISSASNRAGSATYIKPPESLEMPISYKGFKINTEKLRIDLRTVVYFYL